MPYYIISNQFSQPPYWATRGAYFDQTRGHYMQTGGWVRRQKDATTYRDENEAWAVAGMLKLDAEVKNLD